MRYTRMTSQRGVVLILALLIVATVASLAVAFAEDFQVAAARGENRWHGGQARGFLLGAENLAMAVLAEDSRSGETDHLAEQWARQLEPLVIDGGWLQAGLQDAQARFNLNSLAGRAENPLPGDEASRFTASQRRFIRLLQALDDIDLSRDHAIAITEALMDWIDDDDEVTGFGGAESDYYQRGKTPTLAANRPLVSVVELRLVRHLSAEIYSALLPYVVVLPEATAVNINTAAVPLLRTLQDDDELVPLSRYDGEALLRNRPATGYTGIREFLASDTLRQYLPENARLDARGLTLSSRYFLLQAAAQVAGQRRQSITLLRREGEVVRPTQRVSL